jgi:sulfur-oxidizing protein SoxA
MAFLLRIRRLMMKSNIALIALLASGFMASAQADAIEAGIAKYREMLQDGNPAELFEMAGEELWTTPRGPKQATLEACDLGKGPGVIKGAFVELPKFFADTARVQDLESRLVTCMETLQGFDAANKKRCAIWPLMYLANHVN